jgi:hypothetical protein
MKILEVGSRGSSCELTSQSRARLQGSDQPITEAVAVEKESVLLKDHTDRASTGFSKPFSKAATEFLVEVFAGGEKVVRR